MQLNVKLCGNNFNSLYCRRPAGYFNPTPGPGLRTRFSSIKTEGGQGFEEISYDPRTGAMSRLRMMAGNSKFEEQNPAVWHPQYKNM